MSQREAIMSKEQPRSGNPPHRPSSANKLDWQRILFNPANLRTFAIVCLITVLGLGFLSLNSNLKNLHEQTRLAEQIEETRDFWTEIERIETTANSQSTKLRQASGRFLVAFAEFIDALPNPLVAGESRLEIDLVNHPVLSGTWLKLTLAHTEIHQITDLLITSYRTSILKYGPFIEQMNISAWGQYTRQHSGLIHWQSEFLGPYDQAYLLADNLISGTRRDGTSGSNIEQITSRLATSADALPPPIYTACVS